MRFGLHYYKNEQSKQICRFLSDKNECCFGLHHLTINVQIDFVIPTPIDQNNDSKKGCVLKNYEETWYKESLSDIYAIFHEKDYRDLEDGKYRDRTTNLFKLYGKDGFEKKRKVVLIDPNILMIDKDQSCINAYVSNKKIVEEDLLGFEKTMMGSGINSANPVVVSESGFVVLDGLETVIAACLSDKKYIKALFV